MIDISPRVQRLSQIFSISAIQSCVQEGNNVPLADALSHVTPMDPEDDIKLPIIAVNMITTRILMSTDCQGSFSNKLE